MKDVSIIGLYERELEKILNSDSFYVAGLVESTPILKELISRHKSNMSEVAKSFFELVDKTDLNNDDEFCEVFEKYEISELCENWYNSRYEYEFEDMIEEIGIQLNRLRIN